jgi:uncharacterized DUF497 family protein
MHFEWDEAKNSVNIGKHGIDFADVIEIFNHPMLSLVDDRDIFNEERWIAVGWLKFLVAVVVYTERQGDVIRIISARKATKREVQLYEQAIKN